MTASICIIHVKFVHIRHSLYFHKENIKFIYRHTGIMIGRQTVTGDTILIILQENAPINQTMVKSMNSI